MCEHGRIEVESLVTDVAPAAPEDVARLVRRRAIIEAQARLFDEATVPSARTPVPVTESRAAA